MPVLSGLWTLPDSRGFTVSYTQNHVGVNYLFFLYFLFFIKRSMYAYIYFFFLIYNSHGTQATKLPVEILIDEMKSHGLTLVTVLRRTDNEGEVDDLPIGVVQQAWGAETHAQR